MQILTMDEFKKLNPSESRVDYKKTAAVEIPPADLNEYFLWYPDNLKSSYHNGTYEIEYDGKNVKLPIENGILKTDNSGIKEYLVKKGFTFMYARPK